MKLQEELEQILKNVPVLERERRRKIRKLNADINAFLHAPDLLPRLFESLVTTKPRGKGTGLGLRICPRMVEDMGGTISAMNRTEGGACFEILRPAAR